MWATSWAGIVLRAPLAGLAVHDQVELVAHVGGPQRVLAGRNVGVTEHQVLVGDERGGLVRAQAPDAGRHRLDALADHAVAEVRTAVGDRDVGVAHHPVDLDVRAAALSGMHFHRLAAAQHLGCGRRRRRFGLRLGCGFRCGHWLGARLLPTCRRRRRRPEPVRTRETETRGACASSKNSCVKQPWRMAFETSTVANISRCPAPDGRAGRHPGPASGPDAVGYADAPQRGADEVQTRAAAPTRASMAATRSP